LLPSGGFSVRNSSERIAWSAVLLTSDCTAR
jgi:hypothetical protein